MPLSDVSFKHFDVPRASKHRESFFSASLGCSISVCTFSSMAVLLRQRASLLILYVHFLLLQDGHTGATEDIGRFLCPRHGLLALRIYTTEKALSSILVFVFFKTISTAKAKRGFERSNRYTV